MVLFGSEVDWALVERFHSPPPSGQPRFTIQGVAYSWTLAFITERQQNGYYTD